MRPDQLLTLAREQGLILRADGPFLRVRGPRQAVIELKGEIQANKNELLTLLRGEVRGARGRTPEQPYTCVRCDGYFGEDEVTWQAAASGAGAICQGCWTE
jgi:hypothetical protein